MLHIKIWTCKSQWVECANRHSLLSLHGKLLSLSSEHASQTTYRLNTFDLSSTIQTSFCWSFNQLDSMQYHFWRQLGLRFYPLYYPSCIVGKKCNLDARTGHITNLSSKYTLPIVQRNLIKKALGQVEANCSSGFGWNLGYINVQQPAKKSSLSKSNANYQ